MNFRDELARIIAGDPRYSIEAYAFVLEALNHAKHQKLKGKAQGSDKNQSAEPQRDRDAASSSSKKSRVSGHVTGARCARRPEDWPCAVRLACGGGAR